MSNGYNSLTTPRAAPAVGSNTKSSSKSGYATSSGNAVSANTSGNQMNNELSNKLRAISDRNDVPLDIGETLRQAATLLDFREELIRAYEKRDPAKEERMA